MAFGSSHEHEILVDTGDVELELVPVTNLRPFKDDKEARIGGLVGHVDLGRGSLTARLVEKRWGYWNNRTALRLTVLVSITSSRRCKIKEARMDCCLGHPRNDDAANEESLEEHLHPRFADIHPTLAADPDPMIISSSSWSLEPKVDIPGIATIEMGSRQGDRTWESEEGWKVTGELLQEGIYEDSRARFIAGQNEALRESLTNEVTISLIVEYKEKQPFYIDFELSAKLDFWDSYIRTLGKRKLVTCRRYFVDPKTTEKSVQESTRDNLIAKPRLDTDNLSTLDDDHFTDSPLESTKDQAEDSDNFPDSPLESMKDQAEDSEVEFGVPTQDAEKPDRVGESIADAWTSFEIVWQQSMGIQIPWDTPESLANSSLHIARDQRPRLGDRIKLAVESFSGQDWDWWPLLPPRPLVGLGESRLVWSCVFGEDAINVSNEAALKAVELYKTVAGQMGHATESSQASLPSKPV